MTEGGIASWKKNEGDSFSVGDVLLEIVCPTPFPRVPSHSPRRRPTRPPLTSRRRMMVSSPKSSCASPALLRSSCSFLPQTPDGSKNVAVGTPIAIFAEEGDDLSAAARMAAEAAPSPAASAQQQPSESASPVVPSSSPASAPPPQETKPDIPKGDRIFASPIAKKIALEKGIPLAKITGTGPDGRIIRDDVERYQLPAPSASPALPSDVSPASPDYVDIPVSNMRKVIGTRLTASKQEIPHYYLTVEVTMDKALKLRELFNKTLGDKDNAAKLSVNDFILKAVACALKDVPEANSAWLGDVIRLYVSRYRILSSNLISRRYKNADISVAVATPTGLITPIVKDVGSKGLATISAEAKALAKKARDGKLAPQEYQVSITRSLYTLSHPPSQGGTFTVSNLGMFDMDHFTAIINPPQSCILAVGTTKSMLVPAPEEERGFKIANVMKVTLSSDHRTVDGAVGARWLSAFKSYLENPLTFML